MPALKYATMPEGYLVRNFKSSTFSDILFGIHPVPYRITDANVLNTYCVRYGERYWRSVRYDPRYGYRCLRISDDASMVVIGRDFNLTLCSYSVDFILSASLVQNESSCVMKNLNRSALYNSRYGPLTHRRSKPVALVCPKLFEWKILAFLGRAPFGKGYGKCAKNQNTDF